MLATFFSLRQQFKTTNFLPHPLSVINLAPFHSLLFGPFDIFLGIAASDPSSDKPSILSSFFKNG
jgi:hypothetical protein